MKIAESIMFCIVLLVDRQSTSEVKFHQKKRLYMTEPCILVDLAYLLILPFLSRFLGSALLQGLY